MSIVYWGIVSGVISMVALLFFCIAVMPAAKGQAGGLGDLGMTGEDHSGDEAIVSGSRHAA
jgi:hypothetical protein